MKALTVYTATDTLLAVTEELLGEFTFKGCTGTQEHSIGFTNNVDGLLVSDVSGYSVMNITIQKKTVKKAQLEDLLEGHRVEWRST
jgi:hypothetical protein